MTPSLAARFRSGQPVYTAWIGSPEPLVAEACARAGYDAITLDLQHGQLSLDAARIGIAAVRALGVPVVGRIPLGELGTASRLLDMGADGVIAPMIEGAADARRFAGAVKYPPVGTRSYGPRRAAALRGVTPAAYAGSANAETVSFAMIETRGALADLDAILADPGIDAVFVGPADLSIALAGGGPPDPHRADVAAAIDDIAARARAAGRIAGIYASDPAHARACAAKGYGFIAVGGDEDIIAAGARAYLSEVRASGA